MNDTDRFASAYTYTARRRPPQDRFEIYSGGERVDTRPTLAAAETRRTELQDLEPYRFADLIIKDTRGKR